MKQSIYERSVIFAKYILETKQTIRQTASYFCISKSTVHNDISNKLKYIDMELYNKVKIILNINFLEKHIRGGLSTKNKYKNKNKN